MAGHMAGAWSAANLGASTPQMQYTCLHLTMHCRLFRPATQPVTEIAIEFWPAVSGSEQLLLLHGYRALAQKPQGCMLFHTHIAARLCSRMTITDQA